MDVPEDESAVSGFEEVGLATILQLTVIHHLSLFVEGYWGVNTHGRVTLCGNKWRTFLVGFGYC